MRISVLVLLCVTLSACASTKKPLVESQKREASFENIPGLPDDLAALVQDPGFVGARMIGGMAALGSTASQMAKETPCPVRGRVILQYVVNEQGKVEHAQTIMGIHETCDALAERALSRMQFTPAKLNGTPIKMMLTSPVTFN